MAWSCSRVQGDIDLVSCPVLQTALDEFGPATHVILDCARASFIDSAGINLLIEEIAAPGLSGGWLRLRHSEFPVRQVVELTGLIDLFELDNGDGTPDLGAITASTRFAPVSCRGQHRETGAAPTTRPLPVSWPRTRRTVGPRRARSRRVADQWIATRSSLWGDAKRHHSSDDARFSRSWSDRCTGNPLASDLPRRSKPRSSSCCGARSRGRNVARLAIRLSLHGW